MCDEHKLSLSSSTSPHIRCASLPPCSKGSEGTEELRVLCEWSSLSLEGNVVVEMTCKKTVFDETYSGSMGMTQKDMMLVRGQRSQNKKVGY